MNAEAADGPFFHARIQIRRWCFGERIEGATVVDDVDGQRFRRGLQAQFDGVGAVVRAVADDIDAQFFDNQFHLVSQIRRPLLLFGELRQLALEFRQFVQGRVDRYIECGVHVV